jgi:hypothetical protein
VEDFAATRRSPNGPGGAGSILRRIFCSERTPGFFTQIVREWPDAAARAAIAAVALFLFWLTWAHWGDIQVDCGREVYVPYQLLRGKLLYRDLWYPYGPLEPYISAFLLKIFGERLAVLYCLGLALLIGSALTLFEAGKLLAGRAVGLAAALILVLEGFGFTIFNYIFPYTYSAPLGVLLSLLCLFFTLKYSLNESPGVRYLVLAGIASGLALITKQEMGVACCLMLGLTILLEAIREGSPRFILRGMLALAPGLFLAGIVYAVFFDLAGIKSILYENWQYTPGGSYMRIYARRMNAEIGLRFIPSELLDLIANAVTSLTIWFLIGRAACRMRRSRLGFAVVFIAAILGLLHYYSGKLGQANNFAWFELLFPRGSFFIGIGFLLYTLNDLRKNPSSRQLAAEATLGLLAVVSGVRVLAEIAPFGYSIFYTAPLFLVFLIVAARVLAAGADKATTAERPYLVGWLMAAEVILFAAVIIPFGSGRNTKFQTGWGTIYLTDGDASTARQIYDFVVAQKSARHGVLLVPELPMIYAFTGTEAPSRWYSLVRGYLSPDDEKEYILELGRTKVDYVVWTNRWPRGQGQFGVDYDQSVFRWIVERYRKAGTFGEADAIRRQVLAGVLYEARYLNNPVTMQYQGGTEDK